MLCPPFLLKISEGKIGTANPQFFDRVRSVNLIAVNHTYEVNIKLWIRHD